MKLQKKMRLQLFLTNRPLFLLLIVLTFSISSLRAKELDSLQSLLSSHASAYPEGCQLSAAIVTPEDVIYYGFKKVDNKLLPVENKDSIFEIGSITKVFTSAILSQSQLQGDIQLSDKINKYLPFKFRKKITFLQLSTHTSGLPRLPHDFFLFVKNQEDPYFSYDLKTFLNYVENDLVFENDPGTISAYSNLGAALLAYCLEQLQDQSYEQLIQELILTPFDMQKTTLSNDQATVQGHDESGKAVSNWHWNSPFFATGGLRSNASDMVKFIQAYCDEKNEFLQQMSETRFQINDKFSIGLGMHLVKLSSGRTVSFHNGGTGGFSSSMTIDPENKVGIIVLANKSDRQLDPVVFQMMSRLIESLEK